MEKFVTIFVLLVSSASCHAEDEGFLLSCPLGYNATGQVWYAEPPAGNVEERDFTIELTKERSTYKPTTFSVCVTCTYSERSPEVENCIGNESLSKSNLAVVKRDQSYGDHGGSLVWGSTKNPVGLRIDLSNGDLLSTLTKIVAINDTLQQSLYLNCPIGFKLERLEVRSHYSKWEDDRPCIICSKEKFIFSSCTTWKQSKYYTVLMPTLYANQQNCSGNFHLTNEGCQLNVNEFMEENQSSLGIYMNPATFYNHYKQIKDENFRINYVENCQCEGKWMKHRSWKSNNMQCVEN